MPPIGYPELVVDPESSSALRAVGQAEAGPDLQHVVATWWGQAMLDTDPDRDRSIAAVEAGTVATVTMAEVIRRRRATGGAMPGE